MKGQKGLTGSAVKMIAMLCMFIDHAAGSVFQGYLYAKGINFMDPQVKDFLAPTGFLIVLYLILRAIGRVSFPLYCFFLVEGIKYTKSKWKYLLRMVAFAIISEVPFDLAIFGTPLAPSYQNVYFTLALGVAMLWGIEVMTKKQIDVRLQLLFKIGACVFAPFALAGLFIGIIWQIMLQTFDFMYKDGFDFKTFRVVFYLVVWMVFLIIVAVLVICTDRIIGKESAYRFGVILTFSGLAACVADQSYFFNVVTDYGSMGILAILLIYIFKDKKMVSIITACCSLSLFAYTELPCFTALPLVYAYNGKRGKGNKYLFYIFYPAHLLMLGLICLALGLKPVG